MIEYVKCFDSNKIMSSKAIDNKLLKKSNQIWKKKVKNSLNIIFDSQPVYGDHDKSIKKKIKLFVGKLNINFQGRNKSKENTAYKLL